MKRVLFNTFLQKKKEIKQFEFQRFWYQHNMLDLKCLMFKFVLCVCEFLLHNSQTCSRMTVLNVMRKLQFQLP